MVMKAVVICQKTDAAACFFWFRMRKEIKRKNRKALVKILVLMIFSIGTLAEISLLNLVLMVRVE